MRKVTLSALAIALAMGLSACSSSKSSSENDSANQTNQSTRPHLTIIEKGPLSKGHPSSAKDYAIPTTGKFNGIAYEFRSHYNTDRIENPKVHQLSTDNIYVLNIDGKRIDIAPEGVNPAYTYVDKDGEIHLSTGAFANGVVFLDSMQNGIYQSQKDGKPTFISKVNSLRQIIFRKVAQLVILA